VAGPADHDADRAFEIDLVRALRRQRDVGTGTAIVAAAVAWLTAPLEASAINSKILNQLPGARALA
jgi:hypothetical protein